MGRSPMMSQYLETKAQYDDCVLFYRLGDFYEMFYEDAIRVSKMLDLTHIARKHKGYILAMPIIKYSA